MVQGAVTLKCYPEAPISCQGVQVTHTYEYRIILFIPNPHIYLKVLVCDYENMISCHHELHFSTRGIKPISCEWDYIPLTLSTWGP